MLTTSRTLWSWADHVMLHCSPSGLRRCPTPCIVRLRMQGVWHALIFFSHHRASLSFSTQFYFICGETHFSVAMDGRLGAALARCPSVSPWKVAQATGGDIAFFAFLADTGECLMRMACTLHACSRNSSPDLSGEIYRQAMSCHRARLSFSMRISLICGEAHFS